MKRPIVICGFPRAGSTLLYNMLRGTLRGYRFFDRERSFLNTHLQETVTKKPQDVFRVQKLKREFPEAICLFTLRDPRSVMCSKMTHAQSKWKIDWDKQVKTDPKRGAVGYKEPGLLGFHEALKKAIYMNSRQNLLIKYEELVTDPDKVQDKLRAFSLEFEGKFSDYPFDKDIPRRLQKQLNGVRKVETSRIQSWKQHPRRILEQFTECPELFEVVKYWGYEDGVEWFNNLTV